MLLSFVAFYPVCMAYHWMAGAIYYYFNWERNKGSPDQPPILPQPAPIVSILVPCFNEADNLKETIGALVAQNYPNFEIVAINDGSKDATGEILDQLLDEIPNLRVVQFAKNQGKAMGLRMGALAARGEYLVCIDGDAQLHPNAVAHLVRHFNEYPRVGAVTGNPRIRTRSTLLGKVQVGEFSSIVGLIKRTQRVCGNLFTVSGVVCAYRRSALHHCDYWGLDMLTEDIDATWRLQLQHWVGHRAEPKCSYATACAHCAGNTVAYGPCWRNISPAFSGRSRWQPWAASGSCNKCFHRCRLRRRSRAGRALTGTSPMSRPICCRG
jgi:biofilm PGA synthesis N-glycosyltransferase PgaC